MASTLLILSILVSMTSCVVTGAEIQSRAESLWSKEDGTPVMPAAVVGSVPLKGGFSGNSDGFMQQGESIPQGNILSSGRKIADSVTTEFEDREKKTMTYIVGFFLVILVLTFVLGFVHRVLSYLPNNLEKK